MGVYYHYQFKYLSQLTNTRKLLRVEKPGSAGPHVGSPDRVDRGIKIAPTLLDRFLSSGRKWKRRDLRKEGRQLLADS
jgi:hypothetical protein